MSPRTPSPLPWSMNTCASACTLLPSAGMRGELEPWWRPYQFASCLALRRLGPITGVWVVTSAEAVDALVASNDAHATATVTVVAMRRAAPRFLAASSSDRLPSPLAEHPARPPENLPRPGGAAP